LLFSAAKESRPNVRCISWIKHVLSCTLL
jgi:hypothetical protein